MQPLPVGPAKREQAAPARQGLDRVVEQVDARVPQARERRRHVVFVEGEVVDETVADQVIGEAGDQFELRAAVGPTEERDRRTVGEVARSTTSRPKWRS